MKKVALIFGNNNYPSSPLSNAVNDASAVSEKLISLGFECTCVTDATIEKMEESVAGFVSSLSESEVALFFFAGHGFQYHGRNYLGAINTSFVDDYSCKRTSFEFDSIIETFESSNVNTKIFVLDACRNNPFHTIRGAAQRGFAPVYAPKGSIIAFSTSPGQTASDGANDHGVYTGALLTHIDTKRLAIEDMFKRVRQTVSAHTNNQQITWEHTSLMGNFYFNPGYDNGEFTVAYSKLALADSKFRFEDDSSLQGVVQALKSYNWRVQNSAFSLIRSDNMSHDIDELFVLGRNIYQAADGDCGSARDWLENLDNRLKHFNESTAFHILNGILFEIYFDSDGNLRERLKTSQEIYEAPIRICMLAGYEASCNFIRGYLEQYQNRILYLPGTKEAMCIDVIVSRSEEHSSYAVEGICIDGVSSMFPNIDSDELFQSDMAQGCTLYNSNQLEQLICQNIALPRNKATISYNISLNGTDKIVCPIVFVLKRY